MIFKPSLLQKQSIEEQKILINTNQNNDSYVPKPHNSMFTNCSGAIKII